MKLKFVAMIAGIAIFSAVIAGVFLNTNAGNVSLLNVTIGEPIRKVESESVLTRQVENYNASLLAFPEDQTGFHIGSYMFDIVANKSGAYQLHFVNEWPAPSPVTVTLAYKKDNSSQRDESFSVPYNDTRMIEVKMESGERLGANFDVTGRQDQGILLYLIFSNCTQNVPISFTLANNGQSDSTNKVSLDADGVSIWQSRYLVASGRTVEEKVSVPLNECEPHDYMLRLDSGQG